MVYSRAADIARHTQVSPDKVIVCMHAGTGQELPSQASLPSQLSASQLQLPEAEVAAFGSAPSQACSATILVVFILAEHHKNLTKALCCPVTADRWKEQAEY